jgi:hypothetical protein
MHPPSVTCPLGPSVSPFGAHRVTCSMIVSIFLLLIESSTA